MPVLPAAIMFQMHPTLPLRGVVNVGHTLDTAINLLWLMEVPPHLREQWSDTLDELEFLLTATEV